MTAPRTDRLLRTLRPLTGIPLIGPITRAITAAVHRRQVRRHVQAMLGRALLTDTRPGSKERPPLTPR